MSDEKSIAPEPFSLDWVANVVKLMEAHDLSEVHLQQGDQRCRLRRGTAPVMPVMSYPPPTYSVGPAPGASAAPAGGATQLAPVADNTVEIKSPTVGTFYASASPEDEPFVRVGSQVKPDSVVCLVEAMKVYNQITADLSGTVTETCVSNGDAVEFGQTLFRVRPG